MSTLSSRKQRKSISADRSLLMILGAFSLVVIGLIVGLSWLGNQPRASVTSAATVVDEAELLPLAKAVRPMRGFHDMSRLPHSAPVARTLPAGAPQPDLDAPVVRWDWGTIPARPPVAQSFPIQNQGNEPLLVTGVTTSCGCTVAELSSSVIPPGQRADLVVIFDPAYHETVGPVTRVVWVETNDPDTPLLELRLDADVLPQ
jgi:hypothetical protein